MSHLIDRVERLVASNPDLQDRIDAQTEGPALPAPLLQVTTNSAEEDKLRTLSSSPFEYDLQNSKVYRRLRPRDSVWYLNSSQCSLMALSRFSELTLGDLSTVSVFKQPVWSTDLSNAEHYNFALDSSTKLWLQDNAMQPKMPRKPASNLYKNGEPTFTRTTLRMHSLNMKIMSGNKTIIHKNRNSTMSERDQIREEEWKKEQKAILQQQMRAKAKRDEERLK
jgi:hypothetical protein